MKVTNLEDAMKAIGQDINCHLVEYANAFHDVVWNNVQISRYGHNDEYDAKVKAGEAEMSRIRKESEETCNELRVFVARLARENELLKQNVEIAEKMGSRYGN